jgi:CRISPR type III-A-associated protein Csm2
MPDIIDKSILESGIKAEHISIFREWGEYLATGKKGGSFMKVKSMSASQIRKFFNEIKRIQADFENSKNDIILLDPKIAYAVGRAKKDAKKDEKVAIEDFYKAISPMIRQINYDKTKFKHFVNICEAIIAYHKEFEVNQKK